MTQPVFTPLLDDSGVFAYSASLVTGDIRISINAADHPDLVHVTLTRANMNLGYGMPAAVALALADALRDACKAKGAST